MKKNKTIIARNLNELAEALGLSTSEAAEIELRSDLNSKLIDIIQKKKLTHAEVAKLASTSRTRVTAIMNRNTQEISTDLMLRILYSLGYRAKLTVEKAA